MHGSTHEKPFERLSRENLNPLIGKLYDLSRVYYWNVQNDCHFSFKANFYSTPIDLAGKEIIVKEVEDKINVIYREQVVAVHKLNLESKGH